MENKHIYTVTELNTLIKQVIESESFLNNILISGEISNYKKYPSGHSYFTIKDGNSSLKCVMFRSFGDRIKFKPDNGMKVIAGGRIAVYERDGVYQLYCETLQPEGVGALNLAYEQLKKKLQTEGLFEDRFKKAIPKYPSTIVVITSPAGAAVRDIIRILRTRYSLANVKLIPVRVQGEEAPKEIAEAIRLANKLNLGDLIITGRGGGSLEDLWAFNEEIVARAIFKSDIPVISAVGHEPDVTISDYVADRRASTPSNAAEIAVPDTNDLMQLLDAKGSALEHSVMKILQKNRDHLNTLSKCQMLSSPLNYLESKKTRLALLEEKINACGKSEMLNKRNKFIELASKLDALSPFKVMLRGYSSVEDEAGKNVSSVKNIHPGELLTIRFSDGKAECIVNRIKEVY